MNQRGKELAEHFAALNNELIAFVENCSDEDWKKVCSGEEWSVGVVARHVAAGHYGALGLAKMIVDGKQLPDVTAEGINKANAQHSQQRANCTKDEILGILRENGSSLADYLGGLNDADLDRTGYLAVTGGDMSTRQFIEGVILGDGTAHLASMKAATGI